MGLATVAFITHDRIVEAAALFILALARAIDAWIRATRDRMADNQRTSRRRRRQGRNGS